MSAIQLQIPQVPPPPVYETDIDIGVAGNWVVTRRLMGNLPKDGTEFMITSHERGSGLATHLRNAVDRGDRISIIIRGRTRRASASIEGTQP